jgi:hypothetical protein
MSRKRGKKTQSGYLIFTKEQRAGLVQAHSSLRFGEIAKLIADRWRDLSSEEKEIYNERKGKERLSKQALLKHYASLHIGNQVAYSLTRQREP